MSRLGSITSSILNTGLANDNGTPDSKSAPNDVVRAIGEFALKELPKVTLVVALLWLSLRLIQVFLIVRSSLEEQMGLQIPDTPELTLDQLGDTWVQVRLKFAHELKPPPRLVLDLNGHISESHSTKPQISLKDLKPGTRYNLSITAVTALGRTSDHALLSFATLQNADDRAPKSGPSVQLISADHYNKTTVTSLISVKQTKTESLPKVDRGATNHHDSGSKRDQHIEEEGYDRAKIKQTVQSIAELQHEIQEVFEQQRQENEEFANAQASLKNEKEQLAETKKRNEQARAAFKMEVSELEDLRHQLETRREKLARTLDALETKMVQMDTEEAEWSQSILQWNGELAQQHEDETQLLDDTRKQIEKIREQLSILSSKGEELEASTAKLSQEAREASTLAEQIEATIEDIQACVDVSSGLLHRPIVLEIVEASGLPVHYRRQIMDDLDLDEERELIWESEKAKLKECYNEAYQNFRSANRLLESATAKVQAQSHSRSQINLGQPTISRQPSVNSMETRSSFLTGSNSLYGVFRSGVNLPEQNHPFNYIGTWNYPVFGNNDSRRSSVADVADENLLPSDLFADEHAGCSAELPEEEEKEEKEEEGIPGLAADSWQRSSNASEFSAGHGQQKSASWSSRAVTGNVTSYTVNPWTTTETSSGFDSSRNSSLFFHQGFSASSRERQGSIYWSEPAPTRPDCSSLHSLARTADLEGGDIKMQRTLDYRVSTTSDRSNSSDSYRLQSTEHTPKATPERNRWKILNRSSEKTANLVRRFSFFTKKDKELFKNESDFLQGDSTEIFKDQKI